MWGISRAWWTGHVHRLMEAYRLLGWRLPLVSALWLTRPRFVVVIVDLTGPLPTLRRSVVTRWSALSAADIPAIGAIDPTMTPARPGAASPKVRNAIWAG